MREAGWYTDLDEITGLVVSCCDDHSTPRSILKLHAARDRYLKRMVEPKGGAVGGGFPCPMPYAPCPISDFP